ncbi:MAG: hypothetical protein K6D98_05200, partial [Clostridiales bacterium]|nr:hypothetical protein [Clostridiales bacterium]
MNKIDNFTNQYSLSKTLRFKLIPVGETLERFNMKKLLEEDEHRAESYSKVKKLMDDYHREFIEQSFRNFEKSENFGNFADVVKDYSNLYYKTGKDKNDKNEMKKTEESMR